MSFIKIHNGYLKNKKIYIRKNINIRPMLGRIKEIFFNIIKEKILDSKCLDCFTGSGSLGIEAISNGAKEVTFVEININIINNLKKNLKLCNLKSSIVHCDILMFLKNTKEKFDIIFIDPPLKYAKINLLIDIIKKKNIIKKNGYILIETLNKNNINLPIGYNIQKTIIRKYIKYILLKN